jgi:DNA repair protein RecO (recombination protein O)
MTRFTLSAILLRRVEYGEQDLIVDLLSLQRGKLSAIAKHARKSVRRFAGVLELFSQIEATLNTGRAHGMPVLQEAALVDPVAGIRSDARKMAFACYWVELVNLWLEPEAPQPAVFQLLRETLTGLDANRAPAAVLNICFQLRFMRLAGLGPDLLRCQVCRRPLEPDRPVPLRFDLRRGGVVCGGCETAASAAGPSISLGTLRALRWLDTGAVEQVTRIRLSPQAVAESLSLLERFVPFHLGREPRSLSVLRQLRDRP